MSMSSSFATRSTSARSFLGASTASNTSSLAPSSHHQRAHSLQSSSNKGHFTRQSSAAVSLCSSSTSTVAFGDSLKRPLSSPHTRFASHSGVVSIHEISSSSEDPPDGNSHAGGGTSTLSIITTQHHHQVALPPDLAAAHLVMSRRNTMESPTDLEALVQDEAAATAAGLGEQGGEADHR